MQILASIFLHVNARDSCALPLPIDLEIEVPALGIGLLELTDLVALGQVRIEVVLASEDALLVNLEPKSESRARRQAQRGFVENGQGSRKPQADGAHARIRLAPDGDLAGAEQLRLREQLRVDL